jgi:hypothetical protein
VFRSLIEQGLVEGGDGVHHPDSARADQLSSRGRDLDYRLTTAGRSHLTQLGVLLPDNAKEKIPLRYCLDWTEQAHHLSGAVGRNLTTWMLEQAWRERLQRTRALRVTAAGADGLRVHFGIDARAT